MKKFIAVAFLGLGLTLVAASPVLASNGNPHQEESDGCDHGNTGKDCKPDPSENGKDCDVHGNHGGVNEDHCDSDTADEPTTATTAPAVEETTTTTTTQPEVTTTTQQPVLVIVVDPLVENNDAADQNDAVAQPQPVLPTEVEAVSLTQPEAPAALSVPAPSSELPHTGASSLVLLSFGLGLVFTGLGIKTAVLAYTL